MKFFAGYMRQRLKTVLALLLFCGVFATAFVLYRLPLSAVLYPAAVCLVIGAVFFALDISTAAKKHRTLERLLSLSWELMEELPAQDTIDDEDYINVIKSLKGQLSELKAQSERKYSDMIDYYTVWAHQIKTPISSMRLILQNQDSSTSRELLRELFRIEQYVQMVMAFLRLDSEYTDYVFGQYRIDDIIKQALKKYSSFFINRRLTLDYVDTGVTVTTDEKWLSFVIEQLLSNAVKYTREGGTVTIETQGDNVLCIKDDGIGIAPQDLPRIFENGYTGYNGRNDKRASGIGLYLCKRICDAVGHGLSVSSVQGRGTEVQITFPANSTALHE